MHSIDVRDVSVDIPIYGIPSRNLKGTAMRMLRRQRIEDDTTIVHALRGVSVNLRSGDRLGLIGRNGSGKTTLLRVMAGILHPTSGSASASGTIAAMFDLGLGIDAEATGSENVLTRGMLLGQTREQMEARLEAIRAFSGLGARMDHPVRTYSTGMRARLGFSIATSIDPEILLVDEGIGTADVGFTNAAAHRLNRLVERSGIVVLASHDEDILRQICTHAAVMDDGEVVFVGDLEEAIHRYTATVS